MFAAYGRDISQIVQTRHDTRPTWPRCWSDGDPPWWSAIGWAAWWRSRLPVAGSAYRWWAWLASVSRWCGRTKSWRECANSPADQCAGSTAIRPRRPDIYGWRAWMSLRSRIQLWLAAE